MVVANKASWFDDRVKRRWVRWLGWSPARFFLPVGFLFGLLFLLITPPFQVADESRHFIRAYGLAETFLADIKLIPSRAGLPRSLVDAVRQMDYMRSDPKAKTTWHHTAALMTAPLRPENRASYPETASYSFISYLPQLALIIPCRLLEINAVVTLFVARFAALLFWLAITYLAIRLMPLGRPLLVLIALLPMTLFQAASLSADCVTFSLSFLLVSYVVRSAYGSAQITRIILLVLNGLAVVLTTTKLVYAPLIGLYFLIPSARFRSRRTYLLNFAGLLLVCLGALAAAYGNSLMPLFKSAPASPGGVAQATLYPQLTFMLANPLNGLHVIVATLGRYGRAYLNGVVGILGWSGAALPSYLCVLTGVMLGLAGLTTVDRQGLFSPLKKLLMVAICFIITTAIFLVISTDTAINSQPGWYLEGVQGRYFTPFLLVLCLVGVNQSSLARRCAPYVQATVFPFVVFLLLNAVYVLVEHYYVG